MANIVHGNKIERATHVLYAGLPFLILRQMKISHISLLLLAAALFVSCGPSYEEAKWLSKEEQAKRRTEDSLALKIGVLPTLDCLPVYVAKEQCLFDTAKADIRVKMYKAQIDCDAALMKERIEGCVTDLVRGQRMRQQGVTLEYVASTNAYWQLISNWKTRIKKLSQLNDKMVAMARFSATALLVDYAIDSVKLKQENVFRVQINDVALRLQTLLNNEMDAMLLTEPQATVARQHKNHVLMDSRDKDMRLGVVAFSGKALADKRRRSQYDVFLKGYNAACDSINKNGVKHYVDVLKKYYRLEEKMIVALPELRFEHAAAPRQKDIDTADRWLK